MISNAVIGKPLPIYGDGQQVRDWLFVEDHVQAFIFSFNQKVESENAIILVGIVKNES